MKVILWGVRGQTATPGGSYIKYGGNSMTIEIRNSDDELLILDLGTGARLLGPALQKHKKKLKEYNILISSVQYDRILGLPFFVPILFTPQNVINIYGPISKDDQFKHKISESMSYVYFPVRMDELKADIHFKEIQENTENQIGVFKVKAMRINYVTDCYAYKIQIDNKTLVYVPSNEEEENDASLTNFCKDADMLIHDSFFWKDDDIKGWGRSTFLQALKRAHKAKVKKLVMFGLNPDHRDEFLEKAYNKLKEVNTKLGYNIDFVIGKELDEYIL